jgi:hypothetical protein
MMRWFVKSLVLVAVTCGATSLADAQADKDRRDLMELYFASIAADRCDFPLNEADADAIIQAATALHKKMNLKDEAADVLYEEVETAFESKLPDACKKDGEAMKSFQQVLERTRKK